MKTLEELFDELGDRFRELTWHKKSNEWTATGIPPNSGTLCTQWKRKRVLSGGNKPHEALEKLLIKLNEEKNKNSTFKGSR